MLALAPLYLSGILIINTFGAANAGDFQVVARPIYLALISVFSYPIFRFMFPEMSRYIEDKQYVRLKEIQRKFNRVFVCFGIVIIAGGWVFSEYFIVLVFPAAYKLSYEYVNIMFLAVPMAVYNSYLFSLIKAEGLNKHTFLIRLLGAVVFVVSFYVGFLTIGEPVVIAISFVVSAFVMLCYAKLIEIKICNAWGKEGSPS